jgi:enoyl-CoA hydratase/carnithine racemase
LIGESRARELIYTGEPVDAQEALRIGLVNRVAPAGQALAAARALGRTIAERPGTTLRAVKAVLDRGLAMDLLEAQQLAIDAITDLWSTPVVRERVTAFLEKRPARS